MKHEHNTYKHIKIMFNSLPIDYLIGFIFDQIVTRFSLEVIGTLLIKF